MCDLDRISEMIDKRLQAAIERRKRLEGKPNEILYYEERGRERGLRIAFLIVEGIRLTKEPE